MEPAARREGPRGPKPAGSVSAIGTQRLDAGPLAPTETPLGFSPRLSHAEHAR